MATMVDCDDGTRLDPDPFTIILGALGAFGSIASIYSVVEQKREQKRAKRKARLSYYRSIEELTEVCEEIDANLADLESLLSSANSVKDEAIGGPIGATALLLADDEIRLYRRIIDRAAKQFSRAGHSALDLIEAASDARLDVDTKLLSQLRQLQNRMNNILKKDVGLEEALRETRAIANELGKILREMDRPV